MTQSADMYGCQVGVIGGGPAGCAAAHTVGRLGLTAIVFERGAENRDKACGDMFVPSAVAKLAEFGVDARALAANDEAKLCSVVDFQRSQRSLWQVPFNADPVVVVPRKIADQRLRDALPPNVRVLYSTSVRDLEWTQAGNFEIGARTRSGQRLSVRCDSVILACGAQDRLSHRWGVAGSGHLAPAISIYADRADLAAPTFDFSPACQPGYRWVFPLADGRVNAGICSLARSRDVALKQLGDDLLRDFGIEASNTRWRGGAGALWTGQGTIWHNDSGVVSCGDAAALVDPTNGEGLTPALVSGQAAGAAIAEFVSKRRDIGPLRRYSDWVRGAFTQKYTRTLQRALWLRLCGFDA